MELTTEQKARVFSQYIGHQVITAKESEPNDEGETIPIGATGRLTLINIGNLDIRCSDDSENWHLGVDFPSCSYADWISNGLFKLFLRPLSAITDEDAIEVARLLGYAFPRDGKGRFVEKVDLAAIGKSAIGSISRNGLVDTFNVLIELVHFLIQRGYDSPQFIAPGHPLNGKTTIELGLAIERTD